MTPTPTTAAADPAPWLPAVYAAAMAAERTGRGLLDAHAAETEQGERWSRKARQAERERAGHLAAVAAAAREGTKRPPEPPSEADVVEARTRAEAHRRRARDLAERIIVHALEIGAEAARAAADASRAEADRLAAAAAAAERVATTDAWATTWMARVAASPSLLDGGFGRSARTPPADPREANQEALRRIGSWRLSSSGASGTLTEPPRGGRRG
jgi:hypothetical protein